MAKLNLRVMLPTGEVQVPVDPLSTPFHMKENLKYSLRVPPKAIILTCEGRILDDMKQISVEPNNLVEGSIVEATADEEALKRIPADEAPSEPKEAKPIVIKKDEPPKPKKVRKDVSRPVLKDGDVVKKETVSPGSYSWAPKPEWLEGPSSKRHLAFLRIEPQMDDMSKKQYPEQEDGQLVLALGDPQTSPVWTAAAAQLDVGEKAVFQMNPRAVDFDPEGLAPTDDSKLWAVELVRVEEAEDLQQDFQQLLHIESSGAKERAEDLDRVAVHWRIRRWEAEGTSCIASSRERIAIMPGYGLVNIEDQSAPPVGVSVGEGQQESIEVIVARCGPGGKGHLFLKSEAMKSNRPQGTVIMDVELIALDPCRGPGTPGWKGVQSLLQEIDQGSEWLMQADDRRKQLESFAMMKRSTKDSEGAETHVSGQVHKFANNAVRRFSRALQWIEAEGTENKKARIDKANLQIKLAKSNALSHMRFGENQEAASEAEKKALADSLELLKRAHECGEADERESLRIEALKMTIQLLIQAEDCKEARAALERLEVLCPGDMELKDDAARLHRLETAMSLKQGASTVETLQSDLRAANEAKDMEAVAKALDALFTLMKENEVKYDVLLKLKVGKDVGNAMKLGNPDLAQVGRKCVGEIQRLAQQNALGL